MNVLLDTHIIIWLATEHLQVPSAIRETVKKAEKRYVSVVSNAEVAFKHRKNPTGFSFTLENLKRSVEALRCIETPLLGSHIAELPRIPLRHKDPFDHLLMAQAISERCRFVTLDEKILTYKLSNLSCLSVDTQQQVAWLHGAHPRCSFP